MPHLVSALSVHLINIRVVHYGQYFRKHVCKSRYFRVFHSIFMMKEREAQLVEMQRNQRQYFHYVLTEYIKLRLYQIHVNTCNLQNS